MKISSTNREQASWTISVSWLDFASGGKDDTTDDKSGAPGLHGGFFVPFPNVDGVPLKNKRMVRNRMGIQMWV